MIEMDNELIIVGVFLSARLLSFVIIPGMLDLMGW